MKFIFKIFSQSAIIIFITLIIFTATEIIIRGYFVIITKNKNFLYYGIKKDVILHIVDLTESKFYFENFANENSNKNIFKSFEKDINDSIFLKKKIWTFGASLTYGYSCGKNSSSWPNELEQINKNLKVTNFGFPSTFSNDSIKLLQYNLANKNYDTPDYIIWAHKTEEKLAIIRGLGKHNNKISNINTNNENNLIYYILRIEKTIEANSLLYRISKHIAEKLQKRFNLYSEKITTNKQLEIAIENYKFNTIEAIELAKSFGVDRFIILSLIDINQFKNYEKNYFLNKFDNVAKNISEITSSEIIDLMSLMNENQKKNYNKYYCSNNHYTLYGNKEIAKILNEKIFN